MWAGRAALEFAQSWRTWLGTLTFAPHERYRVLAAVRLRLAVEGVSFDALSEGERFRELAAELWPHLRNMVKRLRFAGMELRYLVACEPHRDGFPHFHVLLHEQRHHAGVGRRQIEAQWRDGQSGVALGHASFKLVRDVDGARYACKYLGKTATDRVRASQHYGQREAVPVTVAAGAERGLLVPVASLAEDADAAEAEALASSVAVPDGGF